MEKSLAGRAKRIKAYSIAVEVFGRYEGITPDDPVVRIEAARLRRALERYYLVAGQSDPIRIDIPKGPEPLPPGPQLYQRRPARRWWQAGICAAIHS
jgi:hypothetical protein